jgi:cell division protein FtsI (penicillin-binding protein 3)
VKSSNVGAVKVGLRLGGECLGRYVKGFGFGTKLSPDFTNGESRGLVPRSSNWTDSTLASVSIGYEIGVTPLQMAAAASAVANGGELVTPRVVRAVIDGVGLPFPRSPGV